MRLMGALGWLTAVAVSAGCTTVNPYFDARQSHHTPDGFRNPAASGSLRGFQDFMRWQLEAGRQALPRPAATPTPVVAPDVGLLQSNARAGAAMAPTVSWIGHATVLVQAGGLNVLTDPVFSERASPVPFAGPKRAQPPGLAMAQLPPIDLVLVSHNHYDHLDVSSVSRLAAQPSGSPLFIVPLGLKRWFADLGIDRVVELDWWQGHRVGNTEVVLTPAQHWSGRGLFDRQATLWGGFAVFSPGLHWYYAGDTGYSSDFIEIGHRFAARSGGGGFDLALIPVGAYEPRWFMAPQHVNPEEAVRIHRDVGSRFSVGVHWGIFSLTDEPLDQPPRDLAAARRAQGLADGDFVVMAVGETRRLAYRPGPSPVPDPAARPAPDAPATQAR